MIGSHDGSTRRWTWQPYALGLLIAPALVLLGVRAFMARPGPRAANAEQSAPINRDAAATLPVVTDAEMELADAMRERENAPIGASPFPQVSPASGGDAQSVVTGTSDPMSLSSIMKTRRGAMAVIDGKLRQVGDMVSPGWRVSDIDSQAGSVTLSHDTGPTRVLHLHKETTAEPVSPRSSTSSITPAPRRR